MLKLSKVRYLVVVVLNCLQNCFGTFCTQIGALRYCEVVTVLMIVGIALFQIVF